VERPTVIGRDDGHRDDPELAAGPEDPQRNLAAIRDEELSNGRARYFFSLLLPPRVSGAKIPGGGGGGAGFRAIFGIAISLTPPLTTTARG
jgi:hypothetical protein